MKLVGITFIRRCQMDVSVGAECPDSIIPGHKQSFSKDKIRLSHVRNHCIFWTNLVLKTKSVQKFL